MKFPSKTGISKILVSCGFDPRRPGPMKIIADTTDDPFYFIKRTQELISEAEFNQPQANTTKAIQLLTLAIYYMQAKGTRETLGSPQLQVNPKTKE